MPAATEARRRPAPRAKPKAAPPARPAALLCRGNTKLGDWIYTFSIPAIETCPGATAACKAVCYADGFRFRQGSVRMRYRRNLERTKEPGFVDDMVDEIRRVRPRVVRIHVAGDMYSREYAAKWAEIIRRSPETRFFLYSRSYRLPAIRAELANMATLANAYVWYSADVETGPPPRDPGVRVAYMFREGSDADADVPDAANLVFRTSERPPRKRIHGCVVCPWEQGVPRASRIGCADCRLCFTGRTVPRR